MKKTNFSVEADDTGSWMRYVKYVLGSGARFNQ